MQNLFGSHRSINQRRFSLYLSIALHCKRISSFLNIPSKLNEQKTGERFLGTHGRLMTLLVMVEVDYGYRYVFHVDYEVVVNVSIRVPVR